MKKIIVLCFIIANYSCEKVKISDENTDNTVSIAFWNDNKEIRVGLYSSKKLKNEDYIGKSNVDQITVFFILMMNLLLKI